nr:allatostatin:ISOTYPE=BLAST-3 [Blattella germanica]
AGSDGRLYSFGL